MPPPRRFTLKIDPPLAGQVRNTGFQSQPPFSSYKTENFWPVDVDSGRLVLATRPTLTEFASPGDSTQGITPVNGHASGKPFQSMVACDSGTLLWWDGSGWRVATGSASTAADSDRAVYGAGFLQHAFICKEDSEPIDFNYVSGAARILEASVGTAPSDCRMAAVHKGTLWLAGREIQPHILFGSRTGDAYDWDDSADDEGSAVSTTGQDEGQITGPITALAPQTSDTMLVSSVDGLLALRGHPRRGGFFEHVSNSFMLGQGAWCKTPDDTLFYMSRLGLMAIGPDAGGVPAQVSKDKIPDELIGLSYDVLDPTVAMAYSSRWNMVYITDRTSGAEQAWAYHVPTGGFHKIPLDFYPHVMVEFSPFVTDDTCDVIFAKGD